MRVSADPPIAGQPALDAAALGSDPEEAVTVTPLVFTAYRGARSVYLHSSGNPNRLEGTARGVRRKG